MQAGMQLSTRSGGCEHLNNPLILLLSKRIQVFIFRVCKFYDTAIVSLEAQGINMDSSDQFLINEIYDFFPHFL